MKALLTFGLFLPLFSYAVETDQFFAWNANLKDSTDVINSYINESIQRALDHDNSLEEAKSCEEVAYDIMSEIKGKMEISAISLFAQNSPLVDKYPSPAIMSDREYETASLHKRSIYRNFFVKLARTIKVNGVLMGTDKLGHMFLIGRSYYKSYLENGKAISDEDLLTETVIEGGLKGEYYMLGYYISGGFSFSDLEANFQGLQFAKRLCHGNSPYLKKKNTAWVLENKIDMKDYVNPYFDESFNYSAYNGHKFRLVKPEIKKFCGKTHPLKSEYQKRFGKSKNLNYIAKIEFGKEMLKLRDSQSLDTICPEN